ncbi:MAG: hypothetical protein ACI9MR_002053 [Myxococcota bacterium]
MLWAATRLRFAMLFTVLAPVCAVALTLPGCLEWLEVDDGDAENPDEGPAIAAGRPAVRPNAPPTAGGSGPIVPATPGLRVPQAGYWTRARLDVGDIVLPYTWVAFNARAGSVIMRFEGAHRGVNEYGVQTPPTLRAVIPITLPRGTDASAIAGLTLGKEALRDATVSLRTTGKDLWLVTLERLSLDTVEPTVVTGSFEGIARRGSRGQVERAFRAGFIALRAPEPPPIETPRLEFEPTD